MLDRSVLVHASPDQASAFLASVKEDGRHWLWTGKVNPSGYGIVHIHGQIIGAHRVAYEWARGPIHSWLEVDHTCRVPLCVLPHHMDAVTHLENVRRGRVGEALRQTNHPLAAFLCEREVSISDFAKRMFTSSRTISLMLRGHRPSDPELVYRVGGAIGLSWEETDAAFPRSKGRAA